MLKLLLLFFQKSITITIGKNFVLTKHNYKKVEDCSMSNSAKMSARQRIESLVDANSFVEIGALVTKRNTDFNMQEKAVPADGVITGYGVINSGLVYVYSLDVTAIYGSVGDMHA